jgi:arginyl-tRNA synthetase
MKEIIKEKVKEAVKELNIETDFLEKATFEKPKREEYGDFATNVAFILARYMKEKPASIASRLSSILSKFPEFEKVEVVNGFINFFLSKDFYIKLLKKILMEDFYISNIGSGEKILLEYVSANPTGPLHIGHGRGAVVGDVLYKIMSLTGFKPDREFYINDAGRQIKLLGESIYARMMELSGKDYQFPEDGYKGDYIINIAKELLSEKPEILELEEEKAIETASSYGREKLLKRIKEDLEMLKVSFDTWFSEKKLYENGKVEEVITLLREKGLVYEKEGALWLRTTTYGDDKDRVLRRSNGEYTYFASDIAYHYDKIARGYERAIDIWGADHHGYIGRMKAAVQALGKPENWLEVILIQLVKLYQGGKEVKMSKRSGSFITLRELIEEVGADAVRFFFLLKRHDTPLDFDLDLALSKKSENPVYYVQYAHARLCSIIDKAKERNIEPDFEKIEMISTKDEFKLISECYRLRSELQSAALKREPHRLTYYLMDLSSAFHKFYNKHRVLDRENKALSSARLLLVEAVRKTIKAGLNILNVSTPRRM